MAKILGVIVLCISIGWAADSCAAAPKALELPKLDWQPRSDWLDVRQAGAKGDGTADDTEAIQTTFDQVTNGSTVYLPAGTYRVTKTLKLEGPFIGVLVVGHGRDTRLVWDGEEGGKLFMDDGVAYSRFVGLVFDGRGKAAIGFYHYSTRRFETEVLHQHLAFHNFTDAGVLAERNDKFALAETTFENCLFDQCRRGVVFISFNDYNFTFDGCEFRRCDLGLECRHGNFYARNCHFHESRVVDVLAQPEHGCSLRRCTSTGSKRFLEFSNSVSPLTIQDCHVAGWKDADAAVVLSGAPVVMFDCRFSDPPNDQPPVRRNGQKLLVSENVAQGSPEVVQAGGNAQVYQIPAGRRTGSIRSAEQSFFRTSARIPGKVFDVRRDFGAKGDGRADDTAAVQSCIDAARQHGQGAIAYLPTGDYAIQETLKITGKDYYVGGSGFRTRLMWKGAEGGTMVSVHDPEDVTLENISIGNHDSGPMHNGIDVLQTDSGRATRMTYDHVYVYGMYQKQPLRQGLHFRELGAGAVVRLFGVQGNLRFIDSAQATVLAGISFEGSVIVEGKSPRRDGFLGFLTRLATVTTHGLYLKDNHSVVMSDFYIEQAENGFVFEGSPNLEPGRATLQGGKLHFTVPKDKPDQGTAITVNDYRGQIFFGPNQFYVEPTAVRVVSKGTGPAELFLFANLFYSTKLAVNGDQSLRLRLVGNQGVGSVSPDDSVTYLDTSDVEPEEAVKNLSHALDDLRKLGELDLQLNHPSNQSK